MTKFLNWLNEATTGMDAWKKYFKDKDIETVFKDEAWVYTKEGTRTDKYIEAGKKIFIPSDSKPFKVKRMLLIRGLTDGNVIYIPFNKIKKPVSTEGASENLRINAIKLVNSAPERNILYNGNQVSVKYFENIQDFILIIKDGLHKSQFVREEIKNNIDEFLSQSKYDNIAWYDSIKDSEKNELGKYFGELLIGLQGLNNELRFINRNDIDFFAIPDDPAFSGIDSLFVMKDGSYVPISSKYGVGAKASFFSNLLPSMIEKFNENPPKSKILFRLVDIVNKYGLNPKREAKPILYTYGFNHILNMRLTVRESMEVYYDILKDKENDLIPKIENKLKKENFKIEGNLRNVLKMYPESLTSFFSRKLSYLLNNDKMAIDEMIGILTGKNFYQVNLNIPKWKQGSVKFNITKSNNVNLKITGSKAAMGDIKASQGMLNYELSSK